ncbi:hypothetical protein AYI69_g5900 [Smittium culicis]|uniref:Uncharacterized protein n=1 Tax=Smittium culicis TaxID=133412 RepID=A0A1R1XP09_9FUNG|nr:hypothetical protein AYI69_g7860 [Smittium culicis]OMJ21252.1 hypothetical protein AYI69_g5900 [Smittium culicis]
MIRRDDEPIPFLFQKRLFLNSIQAIVIEPRLNIDHTVLDEESKVFRVVDFLTAGFRFSDGKDACSFSNKGFLVS